MQLVMLLVGLMSATALWSGVQAINVQARSSYDRAAAAFGGGRTAMLVPSNEVSVPQSLFAELRRGGWLVSPVVEGRIRIGDRQVRLIGIEPISLPRDAGPAPGIDRSALQNFLGPGGHGLCSRRKPRLTGRRARAADACDRGRRRCCRRFTSQPVSFPASWWISAGPSGY